MDKTKKEIYCIKHLDEYLSTLMQIQCSLKQSKEAYSILKKIYKMLVPLATSGCLVQVEKFWKAVLLYHNRPNIVNKKIVGVSQAFFYKVEISSNTISDINELFTYASIIYEVRKLPKLSKEYLTDFIKNILEPYHKSIILTESDADEFEKHFNGLFISLRILLPRQSSTKKCIEVVVLDKNHHKATFHGVSDKNGNILAPPFPYTLELMTSGHLRIVIKNFEDAESQSAEWLIDKLFYKVLKWIEEDDTCNVNQLSLSLINLEKYTDLYKQMKEKYGQKFIKIWPENTDPLKFIYEDIAIAAYLICLWEEINPENKPSFVDLGCGNGLLVNILNQEGFQGCGIDVRKRKIWDLYPENVKLEVRTLIPSSSSLFPDVDWIIGNHSDELTPWIPVIAARSSFQTNFFVLPCCSYDFSGQKYKRICTSNSQYNEYINYITEIGHKCGFITKIDKLRIPSTKRICIVSFNRGYNLDDYEKINKELTEFINERSNNKIPKDEENWLSDFEPRQQVEKVRNCTKLDKNLIERIVFCVLNKLLEQKNYLPGQEKQVWNAGGSIELCQLVSCVDKKDLKQLKSECGGLQTLLRNHRYIFEVSKGMAKIRVPKKYSEVSKYKSKPCWFFVNHPDGCLHDNINCAYKHM